MEFVCIGVPYWLGQKDEYTGSVEAIIRIAEEIGAKWVDVDPRFSADAPVIEVNRALARTVSAYADDALPLIFAGDCTSALGAMKGLDKYHPDVLWYDAHGDFNTPESSPSGFLGGMPLAALVGRGNEHLLAALGLKPIAEDKVFITDARDLDPEEAQMLHDSDVTHLPQVAQVKEINWENRPLYIHFDVDVINLAELPATGYPAEGGPSLAETIDSVKYAVAHADVKAVLFSLWRNDMPGAEQSMNTTRNVVKAVVGALRG